jgi:hypothetical protein
MKGIAATVVYIVVSVALLFGAVTAGNFFGLWSYSFFAPKYEKARRDVYENTPSFVRGATRDLENLRIEYLSAKNEEHKLVLADTIRHRASSIDRENLTPELRSFLSSLN